MKDPRARANFDAPPKLVRVYADATRGYRAAVVIDTIACGTSHGGIRIQPRTTVEQLAALARRMTWKYRFIGLPNGGAKAAIDGAEDLPSDEKLRRLNWFGEVASDLLGSGSYSPGPDMGTDSALIAEMMAGRGAPPRRKFPRRFRGSGYYTALTAVEGAEAGLRLRGRTLRGARVAIEGFGAVGSAAARIAARRGAKVIAVSTSAGAVVRQEGLDVEAMSRSHAPLDEDRRARPIAAADLLRLGVDVLLPCGPGGTITPAVAREVQAGTISPGANCPCDREAIDVLHARDIVALPDFVANCGGILSASLRVTGVTDPLIAAFVRTTYRLRISRLLDSARARDRSPTEEALATLPPLRGEDDGADRGADRGLASVRRALRGRLLPRALFAGPSLLYFSARMLRAGPAA